jgi:hypothetical protein
MLIREQEHNEILEKTSNEEYLRSLSDDELIDLYKKADELRRFFYLMQIVAKELCNSVYGGFGTPSLRYFLQEVAEDITGEGRHSFYLMEKATSGYFEKIWPKDYKWHAELREKFPQFMKNDPKPIVKNPTNYGDTDSNYITFDYVFESLGIDPYTVNTKEAVDFIVYFMKQKMDPLFDRVLKTQIAKRNGNSTMIFELEVIGGFGIFVAKKKYVFSKLWEDGKYIADKKKFKIIGLELVQKSTPKHAREAIQVFINNIFVRKGRIDANLFFSMCRALKEKLKDASPMDISKNLKINKYDEYVLDHVDKLRFAPKAMAQIKGAAKFNHLVLKNNLQGKYPLLKSGSRAKMYYDTNGEPFSFPNDADFPYEIAPPMSLDIQLEKLIFNPVKRLVSGGMIDGDLKGMGKEKRNVGISSMFAKKKS